MGLIEGVALAPLRQIADERGAVLHVLRSDSGGFTTFGECYCSEIYPGAIKAWKRHRVQTQNLAVVSGRVRFVIFDPRPDSATYRKLEVIELGRPDDYQRLSIPPGVWYGFACTSDIAALVVNCADIPHDPTESEHLAVGDPSIPYNWSA